MKRANILSNARLFADLLIVICCSRAGAQAGTGSLTGTIQDSGGAAVRNASISLENVRTGDVVNVFASESGDYEVESLRTGVYSTSATVKNITVPVTQRQRIDLSRHVRQTGREAIENVNEPMAPCNRRLGAYKN
ncbi:MAG TPA: carboxypeptidase-like regulatory domain-containing protein [Terracidiphilus sp.]|jgi:hypothetical protein